MTITLTVTRGQGNGQRFVFEEPQRCLVGRAPDCGILVAPHTDNLTVSRHHCEFIILPDGIQVRDLGSRNGTFVNGQAIGRRDRSQPPEEVNPSLNPIVALHDGDEVVVGGALAFQVSTREPAEVGSHSDHLSHND
jgi:pSer/pThr/pTyr-binding forkhead associated (FHA) protein